MMDFCNWNAHLLAHVHEKWGLSDFGQLTCLVNGANGIWASLCDEGAALGHACSTLTIMNLIRMGNVNVLEKYNCTALRESAQRVAEITTGQKPHHKKPVYGERALDLTFDFSGIAGGQLESLTFDFDMANTHPYRPYNRHHLIFLARQSIPDCPSFDVVNCWSCVNSFHGP